MSVETLWRFSTKDYIKANNSMQTSIINLPSQQQCLALISFLEAALKNSSMYHSPGHAGSDLFNVAPINKINFHMNSTVSSIGDFNIYADRKLIADEFIFIRGLAIGWLLSKHLENNNE